MSLDIEGRIIVTLGLGPDGRPGAQIRSSRPQIAQPLMAGRTPPEAVSLARSLFALCGRAHGLAADWACRAARGEYAQPDHEGFGPVLTEVALEHLWYLLARQTSAGNRAPDLVALRSLRQVAAVPERLADAIETAIASGNLGSDRAPWPVETTADPDRGRSTAPLLPTLSVLADAQAQALAAQALETPRWCAKPTWQDQPAETGAIARQATDPRVANWIARRGRGIGARRLARLSELVELPQRLRGQGTHAPLARSWSLGYGIGMAGVETARGLLLHVVRLSGDRVADYRIVAPTEWNFHPQGPIAQALAEIAHEPDPRAAAREIAEGLDACVAIQIEDT